MMNRRVAPCSRRRGFTLVETLVTLVVAGIVLTAVYKVIMAQSRSYGRQHEASDVHNTLRAAGSLLSSEIRHAAAADGDLVAIGPNSLTLRASVGSGIICRVHGSQPRYGLVEVSGEIEESGADSILVLAGGGDWRALAVGAATSAASLAVTPCVWASGEAAEAGVEVVVANPNDTAGIAVGSPVVLFRVVEYGLYQENNEWWFGRKISASSDHDVLTGPLVAPQQGGLEFKYRDTGGGVTNDPAAVAMVDIVLRAKSARPTNWKGSLQHLQDSLSLRVRLRG